MATTKVISPHQPGESAPEPESPPSTEEVRSELERILSHDPFREAPTQRRLLQYLVEQALDGDSQNLKEYNIGLAVFHRGDGFDPRTDSIVRVQAGVLRKKLAAYYGGAGQEDEIVIEVPRGQYLPAFHHRAKLEQESAAVGDAEARPRRSWVREIAIGVTGVLVGLALWLPFRQPPAVPSASDFEWRHHVLWNGFFEPDSNTQLVMGAPMFLQIGGMYLRNSDVNTPEDLARSERIRRLAEALHAEARPEEIYTGLGEAAGLYTLGRFFASGGKDLPLVRSRLARWQDLAHQNLVLLSSFRFRTLSQQLHMPHDFEFNARHSSIVNLRPAKGEAREYFPSMGGTTADYDYALVSVWPSPQPGRRIMVLSGVYTWGTQGAADFVVDPPTLRDLDKRLSADRPNRPDAAVQIVVKVLVKDRQPAATAYMTHHWVTGDSGK